MINCDQIAVESARLKTMFKKCYNLKAIDLRSIVDLIESVSACSGGSFNLKTVNGQSLLGVGNIVVTAVVDGTETKVQQGLGIEVTGNGSIAYPYVIRNTSITNVDGSETKINQGSNITIAGTGTIGDPYVINAVIPASPGQVNADWAAASGVSAILNKPIIPGNTSDLVNDGSNGASIYVENSELALVATSGDYNDLSNTPVPVMPIELTSELINNGSDGTSVFVEADELSLVATSGSYNDLIDVPAPIIEITSTSELINDGADGTSTYVESDELSTVAISGNYSDLIGIPADPTIPKNTSDLINDGADGVNPFITVADVIQPTQTSELINDGSDGTSVFVEADELSNVATSGSYNDLVDTPTIIATDSFVRVITIDPANLMGLGTLEENICNYILGLPEAERTIEPTDSKWNILIQAPEVPLGISFDISSFNAVDLCDTTDQYLKQVVYSGGTNFYPELGDLIYTDEARTQLLPTGTYFKQDGNLNIVDGVVTYFYCEPVMGGLR